MTKTTNLSGIFRRIKRTKDIRFMGVKCFVEVVNSASVRLQRRILSPFTAFVCIENYYPLVLGFDEMLDAVLGH